MDGVTESKYLERILHSFWNIESLGVLESENVIVKHSLNTHYRAANKQGSIFTFFGLKPNLPDLSGLSPFILCSENQSRRLDKQVTHMVHKEFLAGCQPRQA